MSVLRAKCPFCHTYTAVAIGPGYECHACGAEFGAGLVRVPRAWGTKGEEMAAGAGVELPWPEVAIVEQASLSEQTLALALALPERPLVVGGCCCSHVGAIEGLSARFDRLAVVWVDAHGDLNTQESSPSGNLWGMPFRMALDSGAVRVEDAVLIGARNLDPPEEAFIESSGLATGIDGLESALEGADAVYVAFDVDVLERNELESFMPEADGMTVDEAEALLRTVAAEAGVAGAGFTGLVAASAPEPLARLATALGL